MRCPACPTSTLLPFGFFGLKWASRKGNRSPQIQLRLAKPRYPAMHGSSAEHNAQTIIVLSLDLWQVYAFPACNFACSFSYKVVNHDAHSN